MVQSKPEGATRVSWGFLSNHALALITIGRSPESTGLQLATAVGITERATRRILVDLQDAGYITREKVGRNSRYRVDSDRLLVRVPGRGLTAGQLLEFVEGRYVTTAEKRENLEG